MFILESIGTAELILIAIVALIVLGPRRLPQMAKTVAKTIGEFKSATNDFKSTWEKEVAFEDDLKQNSKPPVNWEYQTIKGGSENDEAVSREPNESKLPAPQIKELTSENVTRNFQNENTSTEETQQSAESNAKIPDKRDWL